jgi:hypothetical protein
MSLAATVQRELIRPVHAHLAREFGVPDSREAECLSLACGLQESGFAVRDQVDSGPAVLGPATGYWQFEVAGGVPEIMEAPRTEAIARKLAQAAGVAFDRRVIWAAFATPAGDELACAWARLLTWKDPAPLPSADAAGESAGFDYYIRNWRPGAWARGDEAGRAKLRAKWKGHWAAAGSPLLQPIGGLGGGLSSGLPLPFPPAIPGAGLEARVSAIEAKLAEMRRVLGG